MRSIKNNIKPSNFAVVKAVKDNEIHDCLRKTPFCDIAVFDQKTAAGIHMCNTKLDKSSSMQCFECSRLIKKKLRRKQKLKHEREIFLEETLLESALQQVVWR